MHAILLFSATLHVAAIGLLAAFLLRSRDERRGDEPSFPQVILSAGGLGAAVFVAATVVAWLGRGFGSALVVGLVAGLLAALAFVLALGAWPARPADGQPSSQASDIVRRVVIGLFAALEVVAFCFLAAAVGMVGAPA